MKYGLIFVLLGGLLLTACGAAGGSAGQALPTVVLSDSTPASAATQPSSPVRGGGVTASGVVVPAGDAQLAFPMAGTVAKVNVATGDQVKAGDVLLELDSSAQQVQVDAAQRALRELTSAAAVAQAEQAVADAQKTQKDAQNKSDSYKVQRASASQIENAQASLAIAQNNRDLAWKAYQQVKNNQPTDLERAKAYTDYYAANQALGKAQANLNWLTGGPSETDVLHAQADLDAANAALQEAQWYLSELKGETIPTDATGAKLAQLQQARDALKTAQEQLDQTHLVSPISGTVVDVNYATGEYVLPGQPAALISDVADLQVETSDLSELDVPQVHPGQTVTVRIKALNQDVPGRVISISPISTSLGGDVVYKTTIGLDSLPDGIRSGMSVTVDYQP